MQAGELVTVYEDPITRKRPNGRARLVTRRPRQEVIAGYTLERWDVRFAGERDIYQRWIWTAPGTEGGD